MFKKLSDPEYIKYIMGLTKEVNDKYPDFIKFLENFCGYNTPIMSADPAQISYSAGKRDVILTLKTFMRDDVLPEQIAEFYERK